MGAAWETSRRTALRGGAVLAALAATAGTAFADPKPGRRLPFLLDMVQNNPGEPLFSSRFNDPATLKAYGYDGQVINEFTPPQTAITFETFDERIFPAGSTGRAWVDATAEKIDAHIARAHAAGIAAYFFTDIIVLPKRLVELYGDQILDSQGRISFDRPLTQQIHRRMLREICARFPGLDGIVVRTGETYVQNVPFHTGNNPITNGATSHLTLLGILRDELCVRAGKRVFYRTWSTGGDKLTSDPDFYRQVTDQVETHENLIFSIKHTAKDFWRTIPFNRTIGVGNHRQIIEVECQREYEGKGAFPNYVIDGVVNGFEEFRTQPRTGPIGLAEVADNPIVMRHLDLVPRRRMARTVSAERTVVRPQHLGHRPLDSRHRPRRGRRVHRIRDDAPRPARRPGPPLPCGWRCCRRPPYCAGTTVRCTRWAG